MNLPQGVSAPRYTLNIHHFLRKITQKAEPCKKSPTDRPGICVQEAKCFWLAVFGENFDFEFGHGSSPWCNGYFSLLMYLMMSWMFVVPVMMIGDGIIVSLLCWVLYVADGFNDCGCEDGGGDRE